jgi:hypothetical protein
MSMQCESVMAARTSGDSNASDEVEGDSPDEGFKHQRSAEGMVGGNGRYDQEDGDVQPIDMLVPIARVHDSVGDVGLGGDIRGVGGGNRTFPLRLLLRYYGFMHLSNNPKLNSHGDNESI